MSNRTEALSNGSLQLFTPTVIANGINQPVTFLGTDTTQDLTHVFDPVDPYIEIPLGNIPAGGTLTFQATYRMLYGIIDGTEIEIK